MWFVSVFPCALCGGGGNKSKIKNRTPDPQAGDYRHVWRAPVGGRYSCGGRPASYTLVTWLPGKCFIGNCRCPKSGFYRQHLLETVLPI